MQNKKKRLSCQTISDKLVDGKFENERRDYGNYNYLFDLAIILLSTKLLGLITRKVRMPQVVGALLAGLLLGPAVFNILKETSFIHQTAEIGVVVLMFCAGMETDIKELKRSGKASFLIALIGVVVPLVGGFAVAYFFNQPQVIASDASLQHVSSKYFHRNHTDGNFR